MEAIPDRNQNVTEFEVARIHLTVYKALKIKRRKSPAMLESTVTGHCTVVKDITAVILIRLYKMTV